MSKYVERGPNPSSPLPWKMTAEGVLCESYISRTDREKNGATIVHRVNNWDALYDEVDQLRRGLRAAAVADLGSKAYWEAVGSYQAEIEENAALRLRVLALEKELAGAAWRP